MSVISPIRSILQPNFGYYISIMFSLQHVLNHIFYHLVFIILPSCLAEPKITVCVISSVIVHHLSYLVYRVD
jgi:hypothetical protein